MTDRVHSVQVVLSKNIRDDDVQPLLDALKHIVGVEDVVPIIVDHDSHMAEVRARNDVRRRLYEIAAEF